MRISDFWEAVVLRDVLGYMAPGAVTLVALALLLTGFGSIGSIAIIRGLGRSLWLLAAVAVPLSYVVGYLQIWLVRQIERWWIPSWDTGVIARKFLFDPDNTMGKRYCEAALAVLDGQDGALREALPKVRHSERIDPYFEDPVWHLWRLCDYYILEVAPELHKTYMGRYYVLALLFSNLGMSAGVLAICVLALLSPWGRYVIAQVLESLEMSSYQVGSAEIILAFAVLASFCGVLIFRSGYYRKQFVERVFPIFYALTVEGAGSPRQSSASRVRNTVREGQAD